MPQSKAVKSTKAIKPKDEKKKKVTTKTTKSKTSVATAAANKKIIKVKKVEHLPLKDFTYFFTDFKDKDLEKRIEQWGGTVTKSAKTASFLIYENLDSDKTLDTFNKFNKHDYGCEKDDLINDLDQYDTMADAPQLTIGQLSIDIRCIWFTSFGVPVIYDGIPTDATVVTDSVSGDVYDYCCHDYGDVEDQYSQLTRAQIFYSAQTNEYFTISIQGHLLNISGGNNSAIVCGPGNFSTLDAAVTDFEQTFRDNLGFTWKNRLTCKPKKGAALLVDITEFKNNN